MPNKPRIRHLSSEAYSHPKEDYISMPMMNHFKDAESYWGTLFHELIHSTGHQNRLNRKEVVEWTGFYSESYSQEELVAEIGACYLKSHTGIDIHHFENNVAYIQNWLTKLRNDKRFIIFASAKAQRAVDYILQAVPVDKDSVEV